jgi:hypothetical protein
VCLNVGGLHAEDVAEAAARSVGREEEEQARKCEQEQQIDSAVQAEHGSMLAARRYKNSMAYL